MTDCLWQASSESVVAQPALADDINADIVIVGGGLTGLWTALFLKQLSPALNVHLLEARTCGHGASGRNGGWLMGSVEGLSQFTEPSGQLSADVLEQLRLLVPDAISTLQRLGIEADLTHGGAVMGAARYQEQYQRAQDCLASLRRLGFTEQDYRWLSADETRLHVNAQGLSGAIYTPHVATLNPWKLVTGLANAARALGVIIHEHSAVTTFTRQRVETASGSVSAPWIVLATEGYSERPSPLHAHLLPVQSGMVATAPLTDEQWADIGFGRREAFSDFSRASTYLQRTADNRLVIGARGQYAFGRRCQHAIAAEPTDSARRQGLARALFPALHDVTFTHAWGGTLGIPRNFRPHVVVDKAAGIATAGGYVGEGVGASFLFGRTVAELILGHTTERTALPWVSRSAIKCVLRSWEPEPLPWLGFNLAMNSFDLEERLLRSNPDSQRRHMSTRLCDSVERWIGHN